MAVILEMIVVVEALVKMGLVEIGEANDVVTRMVINVLEIV